jgi:putative SOS response-associated peptidase YedK
MSARFKQTFNEEDTQQFMGLPLPTSYQPSHQVSPKEDVPVIIEIEGVKQWSSMTWGFVPHWAKVSYDIDHFYARAENLQDNMWKSAYEKRRCVIPVDGLYVWEKISKKNKQPYMITRADSQLMGLAGIWVTNKATGISSFAMITKASEDSFKLFSESMPVILNTEEATTYLQHRSFDLLKPSTEELVNMPITKHVNDPEFKGVECGQAIDQPNAMPSTLVQNLYEVVLPMRRDFLQLSGHFAA